MASGLTTSAPAGEDVETRSLAAPTRSHDGDEIAWINERGYIVQNHHPVGRPVAQLGAADADSWLGWWWQLRIWHQMRVFAELLSSLFNVRPEAAHEHPVLEPREHG